MVAQESDFVANYKTLSAPIKSSVDKFALLPAFLKVRGLVKQHIDSFNYFVNHDIHKILKANKRIECSHDPTYYLEYKKISIGMPSVVVDLTVENLTPNMCRLSDRTYAAPILVDVEYTKGNQANKIIEKRNNILIGRMPIMLRSSLCVLCGKDEAELAKLGECPLDPGGYFVVKGAEKVIVIQEQLSKNRIIIDNSKGRVTASVTSSTDEIKSKTVLYMHHDKIYLQLNQFSKGIPILVIMKAMGIESDQEVVQMLGRDPQYGNLLLPSIQECSAIGIHSQQEALDYLDGMNHHKCCYCSCCFLMWTCDEKKEDSSRGQHVQEKDFVAKKRRMRAISLGLGSCIKKHFCADARCVGEFDPCLFCSRSFCLGCENASE